MIWAVVILIIGGMYLLLREFWFFVLWMSVGNSAVSHGKRQTAIRIFERICNTPSLMSDSVQRAAHHNLAWHYLHLGKHDLAVEHGLKAVSGRLKPPIEALYRMRLADCFEASGDVDRAGEERRRASELLDSSPESLAQLMAQGASLKKQGKFSESIPVYEKALAQAPESMLTPRVHLMANLTIACWEAGRLNDTIGWADAALALNPNLTYRTTCLSMSGLALGNLGRLEEAEVRHRMAYEASEGAGNKDHAARHLSMVGETQRRKGNLVAAIETCERAAVMSIASRRHARFSEFETYMSWGRFSEAREMFELANNSQGFAVPSTERRLQAFARLTLGKLEMEQGNVDAALLCVEDAREQLENDEKLAVNYMSFRAWVEAALGRESESRESSRRAADLASRIPDSRSMVLTCHHYLGRAALSLGDAGDSRLHWQAYLDLMPDPVDMPKAYYYLAECSLLDGDEEGARLGWRRAVDTGLDTLYTKRAEARLKEYSPAQV